MERLGRRVAFNQEGKLKIAQFTDIHWDETSKENCKRTIASIRAVIAAEQPDVAMLTGDVVTAQPAMEGWHSIIALFEREKLPFAVMMGNHDAEVLPKEEIYRMLARSPYFIGEAGPSTIHGKGNYVIPVYPSSDKGKEAPAALLYCLDSNDYPTMKDYGTYDWIHFDQIAWYRTESARYTALNGGKPLPALAFFHIPLPEYKEMREFLGQKKEEGVASPEVNSGLFTSLIEMGDVMGCFVGHDHDNEFIGTLYGKALAYGRVSGWDAYGDFERGARLIELHEGEQAFDSWVRTPSRKEYTYYYPSGLSSRDEETMRFLPAVYPLDKQGLKPGVSYTYYEGKFKHTDQIPAGTHLKKGTLSALTIKEAPAKDHFAYEFEALIRIPERGVYRFYTYSDDGSKLWIDGEEVVDNDGSHNAQLARGKVALDAGFHRLRLRYFEDYMGEELEVGLSSRYIPEGKLPDGWLFVAE